MDPPCHAWKRVLLLAFCLAASICEVSGDAVDLLKLSGDDFEVADAEAWRKDRASALVEHVLQTTPRGDLLEAIRDFDAYSESRRMGMNLGSQKGEVIEATLHRALTNLGGEARRPLAVLELGAHFGDGTLRIARPLAEQPAAGGARHTIVSVEGSATWASGCRAVVAHGLGASTAVQHVSLVARGDDSMVSAARGALAALGISSFDVVLLDHEHGRYEADLRELLRVGALSLGGLVHADNAGRDARGTLRKYLQYVQGSGPFTTELEDISEPYPDKVAISEYTGPNEL